MLRHSCKHEVPGRKIIPKDGPHYVVKMYIQIEDNATHVDEHKKPGDSKKERLCTYLG